ncbi:Disease resistance RPP13-like protein 4 [Rhynchospora pubera]|uniref:Disease resistance RPP13-like protein 4 n=1 Tax=Rhynchospora pubera TaxID=906938 RepID=A0AAV8BQH3_9POAL|nr:Disease resistance RPP13-like protein 4 [Rhynchospora pubera]
MSMSNHQKEPRLKTSIQEFVGPLLKRLKLAKEKIPKDSNLEKIIENICTEVVKTKDILDSRENWDRELTSYFGKIERQIDYWTDDSHEKAEWNDPNVLEDLKDILDQLKEKQKDNSLMVGTSPGERESDLPQKSKTFEVGESSNSSNQETEGFMEFLECMKSLNPQLRNCLYSLGVFPENIELKKRLMIYWWIGLGLVPLGGSRNRTAEQLGEIFFSDLVDKGVLIPVIREHNQGVDRCIIKLTIHRQLISACKKKELIKDKKNEEGTWHTYGGDGSNLKALLNLNQRYLNSKEISDNNNMHVVQLGRWCYIETNVNSSEQTNLMDHIEVDETEFLGKMGENISYLSLRGISRIEELHESIGKLENLMILDLRACHNLEKLPQKPSSKLKPKFIRWALPQESWFKKLTHLDISECYLLDHMPKWVCELSNLEVLKGFVVRSGGDKSQSSRLQDLSKLKKIRKLSIRIATSSLITEDFSGLKQLDSLLVLTISWGGSGKADANGVKKKPEKSRGDEGTKEPVKVEASGSKKDSEKTTASSEDKKPTYYFPKNLEKLDIRCYPEAEITKLKSAAELKSLKRLYIRGGMLEEITNNVNWQVETLRLRFLKYLKIDWNNLGDLFKNLKCVEYVDCPLLNFPKNKSCWRKEMDESFQNSGASEASKS